MKPTMGSGPHTLTGALLCVGLVVPENCAISEQQLGGAGLDEWRTAIRNATIGSTHRQSGSIFVASGVKRTETLLGSVVLNFPSSRRLPHNRPGRKRSSHRAAAPDGRTACGMVASICPTRN